MYLPNLKHFVDNSSQYNRLVRFSIRKQVSVARMTSFLCTNTYFLISLDSSKTNYVLKKFSIALSTIRPVICWFNHLKDIKTLEMHSAFWRGNPLIKYFTPIAIVPFVVQDGITNKREYLGEVEHPNSQFCRRLSVSYTPSPVDIPHKCPLAHEVFMVPKQVFCLVKN